MSNELYELATKHNTDKASHGYCDLYEQKLCHMRNSPVKILEIGVYLGASMRTWREYFPNAEIHGIDLDTKRCGVIEGVMLHEMNVSNLESLKELSEKHGPWDLIIDDGSHSMQDQQRTFDVLWSHVNPDGFFVVEDAQSSFKSASDWGHTTYEMCDAFQNGRPFSSKYVDNTRLEEHRSSIANVTTWIRRPHENLATYGTSNSITCMILKKS